MHPRMYFVCLFHTTKIVLIIYDNELLSKDILLYFVMIMKLEWYRASPQHLDIKSVLQTK